VTRLRHVAYAVALSIGGAWVGAGIALGWVIWRPAKRSEA
jgi:hypothetical protein